MTPGWKLLSGVVSAAIGSAALVVGLIYCWSAVRQLKLNGDGADWSYLTDQTDKAIWLIPVGLGLTVFALAMLLHRRLPR